MIENIEGLDVHVTEMDAASEQQKLVDQICELQATVEKLREERDSFARYYREKVVQHEAAMAKFTNTFAPIADAVFELIKDRIVAVIDDRFVDNIRSNEDEIESIVEDCLKDKMEEEVQNLLNNADIRIRV